MMQFNFCLSSHIGVVKLIIFDKGLFGSILVCMPKTMCLCNQNYLNVIEYVGLEIDSPHLFGLKLGFPIIS